MADTVVKKNGDTTIEEPPQYDTKYDDESWYSPFKSEYICFVPNSQSEEIAPPTDKEMFEDTIVDPRVDKERDKEKEKLRKWIGTLSSRPSKRVIAGNIQVSQGIDIEYKKTNTLPVRLPCFLLQRYKAWVATGIDYDKHLSGATSIIEEMMQLRERVIHLESRYVQAENRLKKLEKVSLPEDLLVIFDFQNFSSICRSEKIYIHPAQVVDTAAKFMTATPRNIISAVVVDFDFTSHVLWKHHKYFEFCQVPDMCPNVPNPTDQFIYRATQEAIARHKLRRGSMVALVSGDNHFIPLLMDLQSQGFQTMVISYFPNHIKDTMVGMSKYYFNLASPVPLNIPAESLVPTKIPSVGAARA